MKNTSRGRRAALVLTAEENQWLEEMAGSAKAQRRHVRRAAVMLGFANGEAITALAGR